MKILTLDLGTTMGYAYCGDENKSGFVKFVKEDRFTCFRRFLENTLLMGIDTIFYEDVKRHKGSIASQVYGGFVAILMDFCKTNGVGCIGINVSSIRKYLLGRGKAKKVEVFEKMKMMFPNLKDHNEGDALALMEVVLHVYCA